jgi:hypothetical protein
MASMSGETTPDAGEDPEFERAARARRHARGLRVAARRALALARRYRDEEGPGGDREVACVKQALAWRSEARGLRDRPLSELGPGVARAMPPRPNAERKAAG